jgi:class 3 adenylate cyclase
VNAAIDAQRELQLPVRMGLATGEAELRDGDYFGAVLNRAARVMAAALEGRVRLLVFDNCEHVLDAAADLIDGILAHSACQLALEEELSEPRFPKPGAPRFIDGRDSVVCPTWPCAHPSSGI